MPSFLALVRTDTKPPLFSGDSVQKNSRVFLSAILSLPSELPPITPTLTVYHSFADSTPVKSNQSTCLSSAITNDPIRIGRGNTSILWITVSPNSSP